MNILVTGGAGYIGSHTILELIKAGHTPISVDNYSNSSPEVMNRLNQISGQKIPHYDCDATDKQALSKVFAKHNIDAVIHFAALKAVGNSVESPLDYYFNNLTSLINLLDITNKTNVNKIIFSSSATVYGLPKTMPINESAPANHATNPYGWTKIMAEQILQDYSTANHQAEVTLLRYFNPVGAHPSGLIGEDPKDVPSNLMPYIAQVASGRLKQLAVHGGDYNTPDGSGVRDYIHVIDLAQGHVAALNKSAPGVNVYNLGTGKGVSVLEAIKAFEKASGQKIPYKISSRRAGDVATCYADPSKAERELNWKATKSFEDACTDIWNWQSKNPSGYNKS